VDNPLPEHGGLTMRKLWNGESGFVELAMVTWGFIFMSLVIATVSFALIQKSVYHGRNVALADRAALAMATGANPSSVLPADMQRVGSRSALFDCQSSACYYIPSGCTASVPYCEVDVDTKQSVLFIPDQTQTVGVAPWLGG